MITLKEVIKWFNEFVKGYDLSNKDMMRKYHHSFRVMEIIKDLGESLNLNERDMFLCSVIGLLHDVGRFEQIKQYQTFQDFKSMDHGEKGKEILENSDFLDSFVTKEEKEIILKSVFHHNKYGIEKEDERTYLFETLIREADQLDIMKEQGLEMNSKEIIFNPKLLDSIYHGEIGKNEDIEEEYDNIFVMLSWVEHFEHDYCYQFLKENDIINKKIALLELYGETKESKKLKEFINQKLEGKLC